MNVLAVYSLLKQFGYMSSYCSDGQEAIKAVEMRMSKPDKAMYKLILMDYSMPICDGPTASRSIRKMLTEKGIERPQ